MSDLPVSLSIAADSSVPMAQGATIAAIQVADMLDVLRRLGVDVELLAKRFGLSAETADPDDIRVEALQTLALLEAAGRALQDPLIGLHAGAKRRTRGPMYYLMLSSARASEGLRLWARFASVPLSTLVMEVTVRAGIVDLTMDLGDPVLARNYQAVDFVVSSNHSSLRRAISGFELIEVTLTHPEVGEPGETARVFGCPVRFGAKRNILRFPDSMLDTVPVAANAWISEQIQQFAAAVLARLTTGSVRDRAVDAIRALLASGLTVDRRGVARRLHMSERTLQRHLDREDVTFRDLRDTVRSELARALLANRALKVETVALTVGFAGIASFSKAFSRWSGHSPARFRELSANGEARA